MTEPIIEEPWRTLPDVRARVVSGLAAVAVRGIVVKGFAPATNIAIARYLTPAGVGTLAFATTVMLLGGFLADAGLGAGLLRRREPPTDEELGSLLALQLAVTGAFVVGMAVLIPFDRRLGFVTLVMSLALPLNSLRMPVSLNLERDLRYGALLRVEVLQTIVFAGWTILGLALGWGVWSLATAMVVAAAVATVVLNVVSEHRTPRPRLRWRVLRPLLRFGMQFQSVSLVNVVRDYGLNFAIVGLAGLGLLGQWSLLVRVMQLPMLVIDAFWRVTFPGMARLLEAGEDARRLVERATSAACLAIGVLVTALAAAAPSLVPAVFGERWQPAADATPLAAVAFLLTGPVSMAATGYLYAAGDAAVVLRNTVAQTAVWFLVALPLLDRYGVAAVAVGWVAGGAVDMVNITRRAVTLSGARLWRRVLTTAIVGSVVLAASEVARGDASLGIAASVVVGVVADGGFLVLTTVVQPAMTRETVAVGRRGFMLLRRVAA